MAWRNGRKRTGAAEGFGFRISPEDRVGGPPKKARDTSRRPRSESSPKPKKKKARTGGRGKGRSRIGRLIYWGAVLALWGVICAIGVVIWIGAHLPPIQSLEIPKRPPSVLIVGANGATLAFTIGLGFAGTLAALGITSYVLDPGWLSQKNVAHAATTMAPRFEVDPLWPKPLPNHWIMGKTIGVSVDAQDHVWIIHRAGSLEAGETARRPPTPPTAQCCAPAPPVLEFDQAGQSDRTLGRPGPGLRLAGFEPRHHGRLQRQRVDRRQRPRAAERSRRDQRRRTKSREPAQGAARRVR